MTEGWRPDPTGEHDLRYWDGQAWTSHVSSDGVLTDDPVPPPLPGLSDPQLAAARPPSTTASEPTHSGASPSSRLRSRVLFGFGTAAVVVLLVLLSVRPSHIAGVATPWAGAVCAGDVESLASNFTDDEMMRTLGDIGPGVDRDLRNALQHCPSAEAFDQELNRALPIELRLGFSRDALLNGVEGEVGACVKVPKATVCRDLQGSSSGSALGGEGSPRRPESATSSANSAGSSNLSPSAGAAPDSGNAVASSATTPVQNRSEAKAPPTSTEMTPTTTSACPAAKPLQARVSALTSKRQGDEYSNWDNRLTVSFTNPTDQPVRVWFMEAEVGSPPAYWDVINAQANHLDGVTVSPGGTESRSMTFESDGMYGAPADAPRSITRSAYDWADAALGQCSGTSA